MVGEEEERSSNAGAPLPVQAVTTVCPYEPCLPAPPTPKGTTAAGYHEPLNARDPARKFGKVSEALFTQLRFAIKTDCGLPSHLQF